MRKLLAAGAAFASLALATAGHAAAYGFAFNAGTYSPQPAPQLATGTYTDTFNFTTDRAGSFSGSLTTRYVFNLMNNPATLASDLDFLSISLDSTAWTPDSANTDALETWALPSTMIGAGAHTVSVTYRVDTVSPPDVGASYGGVFNFVPGAVPEPATWAMMLAGFGLIGATMRRGRRVANAFAR